MQSYPINYIPFNLPRTKNQKISIKSITQNYQIIPNIQTDYNIPIIQKNLKKTPLLPEKEIIDPKKAYNFYPKRIDKQLFKIYSTDILLNFFKKSTSKLPCVDFLEDHQISSDYRGKMVDWMIEIFYKFNSNEQTFFAAVNIMDRFISEYDKILGDRNLYIIGLTSIYIASKVFDTSHLFMHNIIHDLGKDDVSVNAICYFEQKILKTISFEIFGDDAFDTIEIIIIDMVFNNKKKFGNEENLKCVYILENTVKFVLKVIKHYDIFSPVKSAYLAFGSFLVGYDLVKENSNKCKDIIGIFKKYLNLVIDKIFVTKEGKRKLLKIYQCIREAMEKFSESNYQNLRKFHGLIFE